MSNKLPKGIRLNKGKFRWEIMVDGQRRSGTSATLDGAVTARDEARNQLLIDTSTPLNTTAQYKPNQRKRKSKDTTALHSNKLSNRCCALTGVSLRVKAA